MINNVSLREIGNILEESEKLVIFPHENPDGDALGSAIALCKTMRQQGKTAWVLLDEEVAAYINFIDNGFTTTDQNIIEGSFTSVCVDCGDYDRLSTRVDKYKQGSPKVCIDHHATSGSFGDYYYIDGGEAATCQIIFKLIREMGYELDLDIAKALYTGISTDTGSFQHSNTTWETHYIVSELLKVGVNPNAIAIKLYQNVSLSKMELQARAIAHVNLFADGKGAISYIRQQDIDETGAALDDAEGVIDFIKSVEGVEIAALLKEREKGIKVSMRAKSYGRVDEIALKFGGGGHVKAAGCTLNMSIDEAMDALQREMTKSLEDQKIDE